LDPVLRAAPVRERAAGHGCAAGPMFASQNAPPGHGPFSPSPLVRHAPSLNVSGCGLRTVAPARGSAVRPFVKSHGLLLQIKAHFPLSRPCNS
jgi:hypothetical protein